MIKNVLFDFAQVLVEVDFSAFMEAPGLPAGLTNQEVFDRVDQTDLMARVERGEITFEEFYHGVRDLLDLREMSLEQFEAAWRSTIPREIPGMRELVREIKAKGLRVAVLSNLDSVLEDEAFTKFGILEEFDWERVFISWRLGMVKPDPAVFRHVLKEWGVKPEETLFVDDRPYHVEGARSMGCQGHIFTGSQDLRPLLGL